MRGILRLRHFSGLLVFFGSAQGSLTAGWCHDPRDQPGCCDPPLPLSAGRVRSIMETIRVGNFSLDDRCS